MEKAIGSKTFVGFNWHNGVLNNVTVNFEGIPDTSSISEIVTTAKNSVSKHFKQSPDVVVVSFTVSGSDE